MRWSDIDCEGLRGLEVWSFVTDEGETIDRVRDALRFLVHPDRFASGPPEENLREWDRLNAERRVVGIGGVDAHQFGRRILGRRVVRLMGYRRTFRQLRTHVLVNELPSRDLVHDRAQVYDALRDGRCYIAVDHLARPAGFAFWEEDGDVHARVPQPADIRLLRDGVEVARTAGAELDHAATGAGAYRVEVRLGGRVWILSNPVRLT